MKIYPITIPGGSDTHVQYNNGGVFGGDATFTFNDSTKIVKTSGITTKKTVDNVSDPPTDNELDSAFGAPAAVGAGFVGVIDDNDGGTDCYMCWTTGTADEWFYIKGTKAVNAVAPVTGNPIGLLLSLTYS